MTRFFGNFIEAECNSNEYLVMSFSPTCMPLKQRWRNNGLSADFLADYLSTIFPGGDDALEKKTEIKDAVSYVANELLENAMKFNHPPARYSVGITMLLEKERVRLYVANSIDPQSLLQFQEMVEKLLTEDPEELYLKQLTANAEDESGTGSGLGFLTMLTNYGAKLAWKVECSGENSDPTVVTTMVQLTA